MYPVRYCGRDCQSQDWKKHRHGCHSLKSQETLDYFRSNLKEMKQQQGGPGRSDSLALAGWVEKSPDKKQYACFLSGPASRTITTETNNYDRGIMMLRESLSQLNSLGLVVCNGIASADAKGSVRVQHLAPSPLEASEAVRSSKCCGTVR
ncbi:hypothetical protein WJX84_006994 [Apatococcus fuscideae]|uniref:MYND-type domain-containing protein n=1 Tax=Apatococcus fuscideae TaxID=2026836 RepID=A0AAW1S461_9CHLO